MMVDKYGINCIASSAFLRLDLFDQIGIRNLLSVTNDIHAFGIPGVFNIAAENDGGVFFVKLHHVADAVHLLTRHERRAAAAEGVDDHGILLRGVADGITEQVERLAGRVVRIALRLIEIPDGRLLAVGIPLVLAVLHEAVQHRFVLPLIIGATEDEAVLYPDAAACKVEACVDECTAEVQPFGVCVEHISRTAFFEVCRHTLKRSQQEAVELLVLHAVVLDGQTAGAFERYTVGRIGQDQICLNIAVERHAMSKKGSETKKAEKSRENTEKSQFYVEFHAKPGDKLQKGA